MFGYYLRWLDPIDRKAIEGDNFHHDFIVIPFLIDLYFFLNLSFLKWFVDIVFKERIGFFESVFLVLLGVISLIAIIFDVVFCVGLEDYFGQFIDDLTATLVLFKTKILIPRLDIF